MSGAFRFLRVARLDDLDEGSAQSVEAGGVRLALARLGDEVVALDDACPHKGAALGTGRVSSVREQIACPWHFFRYDLRGGACLSHPGTRAAKIYRVRVEDGEVYVELPAR